MGVLLEYQMRDSWNSQWGKKGRGGQAERGQEEGEGRRNSKLFFRVSGTRKNIQNRKADIGDILIQNIEIFCGKKYVGI